MEKKVILIGDGKKFMVKAVIKGLETDGFAVTTIYPQLDIIQSLQDSYELMILYLEDIVPVPIIKYLAALSDEKKIKFFIIGSTNEFTTTFENISRDSVTQTFERPLNVKILTNALNILIDKTNRGEGSFQKRILVVDDDGVILRTIKSWLSEKYEVYIANSGENALAFLGSTSVDLVLLDFMMPEMSGPETLTALRENQTTKDTPVMFLTAKSDKTSVMTAAMLKPEKYLLKSMPKDELLGAIDSYFETGV
jgi:CheY-like chemotaxis protein